MVSLFYAQMVSRNMSVDKPSRTLGGFPVSRRWILIYKSKSVVSLYFYFRLKVNPLPSINLPSLYHSQLILLKIQIMINPEVVTKYFKMITLNWLIKTPHTCNNENIKFLWKLSLGYFGEASLFGGKVQGGERNRTTRKGGGQTFFTLSEEGSEKFWTSP